MTRQSLLVGSGIIIAWVITMGFLLRNHYLQPDPTPAYTNDTFFGSVEAVQKWRDVEESMIILQAGRPVGASITEIRQTQNPDNRLTYVADFRMNVKVSPILPEITFKGKSLLTDRMQLEQFHATANLGPARFAATGKSLNNLLYLSLDKPNGLSKQVFRLNDAISLAEAIRPAVGSQLTIAPGNSLKTKVIDPLSGQSRGTLTISVKDQEEIIVGGESTKAYRVVSSIQDIETTMWVDAYGQTLKRNLIGEFTMERSTMKDALKIAPGLAEKTELPELDLADFKDVPVQSEPGTSNQGSDSALSTLRTLLY